MNSISSVTEITRCVKEDNNIIPSELVGYHTVRAQRGIILTSGTFCTSIKMTNGRDNKCFRIWQTEIKDIKERCKLISDYFIDNRLPYFVGFQYEDRALRLSDGRIVPGMIMDWISEERAVDLYTIITRQSLNTNDYSKLANNFLLMCESFKKRGISHGDLSARNIFVDKRLDFILIDYDSLYLPNMRGRKMIQSVDGTPGYQHPHRGEQRFSTDIDDYFSQLIIYLFFLACSKDLNVQQFAGDPELLFSSFDLNSKQNLKQSPAYKYLSSIHDYEINHYLSLLETNIESPYSRICSVIDNIYKGVSYLQYCRVCGKKYSLLNQKFCHQCGSKREVFSELESPENVLNNRILNILFNKSCKTCPSCGYHSERDGNYCGNCGNPYHSGTKKEVDPPGTERSLNDIIFKYEKKPTISVGLKMIWNAVKDKLN